MFLSVDRRDGMVAAWDSRDDIDMLHRFERFGEKLVERPAEHVGSLLDDFAGATGGKIRRLVLAFDRLEFHVLHAFRRSHECRRADETGQFVGRVENFFHAVFRCERHASVAPTVRGRRPDDPGGDAVFAHDFLLFHAMLIGKFSKVKIVQQANDPPEFGFVAEPFLLGKIFHDPFHDLCMVQVERVVVVLCQ